MLSRLALGCRTITLNPSIRKSTIYQQQIIRNYAREAPENIAKKRLRWAPTKSTNAPANAINIGKGALAGGAVIGLAGLCWYGSGLARGTSTLDNSMLWPQYVKERIHNTYLYFGGSCALSALSAVAIFRTPALLNIVARNGWMSILATFAAMIGTGMLARSVPYDQTGLKHAAWMLHCGVLGGVLAPLCFIGGPIITRAALYTAGVVSGLSTIAVCAPNDKFLYMGGTLGIGLGVVFASSVASMFLSPVSALGAGLYSVSLYGGLLLFSGFLLYDTQRIIRTAETYPNYASRPFDPINAALSIYIDTINIFVRIVSILAGGGGSRRK